MKTTNAQGEAVRGFAVTVYRDGKKHPGSYPAKGCPYLTGAYAAKVMNRLAERGFTTLAHTEANGISETLTLEEMAEIYPEAIPPRVTQPE